MATINDKFTKAADGTGTYPAVASVTQPREAQGDTLSCDDLSGWPTDTAVHFTTFRVLADGKIDTSTQTDYKGIVVDNTITRVTRIAGAEDSGHLVGDKVEVNPTIGWVADLVEGLLKSHNQDGTLKNNMIQTSNIKDGAITSAKIANKTIIGDNIADSTIKAQNVDFATIMTTLYDDATGSNGSVTLSESVANFKSIEVFFRSSDNMYNSMKISSPNGKKFVALASWWSGGGSNLKFSQFSISGNKITQQSGHGGQTGFPVSGGHVNTSSNDYIYIYKVVGYKI